MEDLEQTCEIDPALETMQYRRVILPNHIVKEGFRKSLVPIHIMEDGFRILHLKEWTTDEISIQNIQCVIRL